VDGQSDFDNTSIKHLQNSIFPFSHNVELGVVAMTIATGRSSMVEHKISYSCRLSNSEISSFVNPNAFSSSGKKIKEKPKIKTFS